MASTSDPLLCRSCFWAADLTRDAEKVWCAHAGWAGWHSGAAPCRGVTFVERRPWHCSIKEYKRYAADLGD